MSLEVIKKYTAEEAEARRLELLEELVYPVVLKVFKKYPNFKSAALLLRHDERGDHKDAVRPHLAFSVKSEPDLQAWADDYEVERDKSFKGRAFFIEGRAGAQTGEVSFDANGTSDVENIVTAELDWKDNADTISMFSAYCPGADDLRWIVIDNFAPFAVLGYDQKSKDLDVLIVGNQYRPWLDGVMPLSEQEEKNLPEAKAYRKNLETGLKSRINKLPGDMLIYVQDYFDGWIGPDPDLQEPVEPMTEFEALKLVMTLLGLIFLVMFVLTLIGVT